MKAIIILIKLTQVTLHPGSGIVCLLVASVYDLEWVKTFCGIRRPGVFFIYTIHILAIMGNVLDGGVTPKQSVELHVLLCTSCLPIPYFETLL